MSLHLQSKDDTERLIKYFTNQIIAYAIPLNEVEDDSIVGVKQAVTGLYCRLSLHRLRVILRHR